MSPADRHVPAGTHVTSVEVMSPAFTKYHLSDGRALHHFTAGEPDAEPHDHPWNFETTILEGGYLEEVFVTFGDLGWRIYLMGRYPGDTINLPAEHIHRIVSLPTGECWTIVRAGPATRQVRFWRFPMPESRAWNEVWA